MPAKYPIEYELEPREIKNGLQWVTCTLTNRGEHELTHLSVKLNSLDPYAIYVYGAGEQIAELLPGETRQLGFQVSANATARVYISVDGWEPLQFFHWESREIVLSAGQPAAELVSLRAVTEGYAAVGEGIQVEATVRGLGGEGHLSLEFWADTPGGEFELLATVEPEDLTKGQEAKYFARLVPEQEGLYALYAYLYDGIRRVDRGVEYVYATKSRQAVG